MRAQLRQLGRRIMGAEPATDFVQWPGTAKRLTILLTLVVVALSVAAWATATPAQMARILQAGKGTDVKGPLTVLDDAGRPIVQIGAGPLGRGMVLFDEAGRMVCGIGLTGQGRGLMLFDAQQRPIAALGEGSAPGSRATGRGLTVFDPEEKVIATLGQGANGPSTGRGLTVNNPSGAPVAGLGVWPQRPDRGQLMITQEDGPVVFAQPPSQ
jgi:hypothetical protein